ncbi:MAG TPA: hypothetical protein VKR41_02105, partial [Puia sp.]|nr:hypothetical protein [Puia sp.]
MNKQILFFALLLQVASTQAQAQTAPSQPSISFHNWLSIAQAGGAVLSPDGANIAYTVTTTDWKENGYHTEIWLSRQNQPPFQLTHNSKSSSSLRWSPDSKWIAFLSDRGDKTQIYLISAEGGEAFPLTKEDEGISSFAWSPDGRQIAFIRPEADSKTFKNIKDRYGSFGEEGKDFKLSHLWLVRFSIDSLTDPVLQPDSNALPTPTRLTSGNFTVTDLRWSPAGNGIAYNRQPDPYIPSSIHAAIDVLDPNTHKITTTIADPAGDQLIAWSPDGNSLLYTSPLTDTTSNYYKNNRLFITPISAPTPHEIAAGFDENKSVQDWNPKGIFFIALQHTRSALFHLDPATGEVNPVTTASDVIYNATFSKDGSQMAWSGR